MPSLNVDLLNSALSAMMGAHKFVSEKEFREQVLPYASYTQVNLNSFHQTNHVGDDVDSIVTRYVPSAPAKPSNDKASKNAARQSIYQQVDLGSLHQVNLIGGDVGSGIK